MVVAITRKNGHWLSSCRFWRIAYSKCNTSSNGFLAALWPRSCWWFLTVLAGSSTALLHRLPTSTHLQNRNTSTLPLRKATWSSHLQINNISPFPEFPFKQSCILLQYLPRRALLKVLVLLYTYALPGISHISTSRRKSISSNRLPTLVHINLENVAQCTTPHSE